LAAGSGQLHIRIGNSKRKLLSFLKVCIIKVFADMRLGNILILIAMAIFAVAIIIGSRTPDTWRYTGITWILLMLGLVFFAAAITIS
jgi:hypothetical protein